MSDFKIVSLLNPGGVNFNSGVVGISAGTELQTTGTVSFANSNGVSFGLSAGTMTASAAGAGGPFAASVITIDKIGTPSYTELQSVHDLTRAAGHLDGGGITDAGSATIDVAAGKGFIRASNNDTSTLYTFDWSAASGVSIPTDTIRYVRVDYNGGSPIVSVSASEDYDYRTGFPLGFVVNEGGTLYINETPHSMGRASGRFARRNYEVEGRSRANQLGGLILSETGTRNVGVTAGVTWLRGVRDSFAGLDTSSSGSFARYYRNSPSGWNIESAQTQTPNDNYDDGSGTLAALSPNNYGVRWFLLGPANGIVMLYGRGNHANVAAAEAEAFPSDLPLRVQVGSLLLGRIIYRKGASSATSVTSAFAQTFSGAVAGDHGNLAGLADDDHTQYHLRSEGVIRQISAGTQAQTSGSISFSNANGLSFGLNAGTLTASHNALTSQSNQALSGSNGSFTFQTATFGNLNGLSFYTSNGSLVGSYTVPSQTVQPVAVSGSNGSFTFSTVTFGNLNGLSFYTSNGSMVGSHNALTTAALSNHSHGNPTLNLTNLSGTTASNSAGLTLSLSAAAPGAGGGVALSAGTQSVSTGTVVFSNSNGVSWGMSGSSRITASVAVNPYTYAEAYAGDNTTVSTQATLPFDGFNVHGLGIVSVGLSGVGSKILISATQSNQAASGQNGSFAFQTLGFSNANGISFGTSAGSSITASHNGLTSQSNQALSGSNGSFTFQTATFGNLNGLSFYTSNGSMVGSYTVPAAGLTQLSGYAVGNTTQSSSGTIPLSQLSFRGDGVASVGVSNGSVVISVPAGGGGLTNINVSAGTTSQNLSAVTFGDGGNVSFGLNGSVITATAPAGGGGGTVDRYLRAPVLTAAASLQNNSSVSIFPFNLPGPLAFSNLRLALSISGATTTITSSAGMNLSMSFVLYTRNVSTLSSLASGSNSTSGFYQSNSVTQTFGGGRGFTIDVNGGAITLVPDEYWLAVHVSTATAGQTSLAKSISMGVLPSLAANFAGLDPFMAATTNTRGAMVGLGVFSTNATRATIAFSALTGQASNSATLANLWCDLRNWSIW